ncbi:MAG: type II toxin-antitoxin system RatA family toxin [Gammaproteobacteria bacterium]|nr:MAG: type II toxin-antitoxin system RatA family toxin [Gammaproteobacteria bacterium]RLA13365.1 MAG: type II toxin-antitoxin system RatA family toxin [Gammaproteobacteria bacterium]RLA14531.1 MAG: type II toxin-antitoxin system RatA family toxin [Gammaproteobacteria bacterium]
MRRIHRTALLPYSAEQLYDLVNDVDAYPQFLPWCRSAKIEQVTETEVVATLDLALKALHKSFTTRNHLVPGREIRIELENGPFRTLEGRWQFSDLQSVPGAETAVHGCRITLDLSFALAGRILEMTAGPILEKVADSMVELFSERARVVCADAEKSADNGAG